MRVEVAFQDERFGLDVAEDRLVGAWEGPAGIPAEALEARLDEALEHPSDFPPLRQAVVPGDRVGIALGADVPGAAEAVAAVAKVLRSAGVEPDAITVVAEPGTPDAVLSRLETGPGVLVHRHDPDDRNHLAYLANTTEGRRVYLNRTLVDADLVVPIGRLAHDRVMGHAGPWSVVYPGLSDTETRHAFGQMKTARRGAESPALRESIEANWLLGCQFQLGLVDGASGPSEVVAGLGSAVLQRGADAVDRAWGFEAESRAELVVVGVGRPGATAGPEELARGLANATRLVQHGGKIVVLSRVGGTIGPALNRLRNLDDPRSALAVLKGHEHDPDHAVAREIRAALAWADVYLLSDLDPELVEEFAMIPLERPEEARRLAAVSGSCLVVSHADLGRASVADEHA